VLGDKLPRSCCEPAAALRRTCWVTCSRQVSRNSGKIIAQPTGQDSGIMPPSQLPPLSSQQAICTSSMKQSNVCWLQKVPQIPGGSVPHKRVKITYMALGRRRLWAPGLTQCLEAMVVEGPHFFHSSLWKGNNQSTQTRRVGRDHEHERQVAAGIQHPCGKRAQVGGCAPYGPGRASYWSIVGAPSGVTVRKETRQSDRFFKSSRKNAQLVD
jgi:hypothetical protein